MPINFTQSETKLNLLRAFAGESQARNRYTFAAEQARTQKLHVIEAVFTYTANQEKEHAEIFYQHLRNCAGENVLIDGTYPIDITASIPELLRMAQHNEFEEHSPVYPAFADKAEEEGFPAIAYSFRAIAEIEKTHGDRFAMLAERMEQDELFSSAAPTAWVCLNCGHIHTALEAPAVCPVCSHDRGFFISLDLAPYSK